MHHVEELLGEEKPLKLLSPPKYPHILMLDSSCGCVTHVSQSSHLYRAYISCSLVFLFSSPSSNTSCLWLSVIEFPGALIVLESLHFYNLILLFRRKFGVYLSPSQKKREKKGGKKKSYSPTNKEARYKKTRLFSFSYS